MESGIWRGFGVNKADTVLHFMPAVKGSKVPHSVECHLAVFSDQIEPKTVLLDGARVAQPDGLLLKDAFPQLASSQLASSELGKASGELFGIEVAFTSAQGAGQTSLDLSASGAVFEVIEKSRSARYQARYAECVEQTEPVSFMIVNEWGYNPSIVAVNGGETQVELSISLEGESKNLGALASLQVKEFALARSSSPAMRAELQGYPSTLSCYLVYRDTNNSIVLVEQLR